MFSLESFRLSELACNVLQNALNQMGILWSSRRNWSKAQENLQASEVLYREFTQNVGTSPYSIRDLFALGSPDDTDLASVMKARTQNFEDTYTHTLYYMAQVLTHLGETEKSAEYCHVTLQRQLRMDTLDCIEWSLNAATLSQFYISQENYEVARHCLASAERVLERAGHSQLSVDVSKSDSQAEVDRKEKLPRAWADLYRCWVKYGLVLLENSMESSLAEEQGEAELLASLHADRKSSLLFDVEATHLEESIPAKYVTTFEQALPVFKCVQSWLNKAKQFYVLDGHCSDHVEVVQDNSKALKLLAFFEPHLDRQCKMHKRRIDMLEAVLAQLNMQHYLLVCRQLIFELAETYSAMMDLKLAIMEEAGGAPTVHQAKKCNKLVSQSIDSYERYLDTLRKPDKTFPEQFSADDERAAIVANFCLGRLFSKYIEVDTQKRVQLLHRSHHYYKLVSDYAKRNESVKSHSKTEVEICDEMVALMPVKIKQLLASAS